VPEAGLVGVDGPVEPPAGEVEPETISPSMEPARSGDTGGSAIGAAGEFLAAWALFAALAAGVALAARAALRSRRLLLAAAAAGAGAAGGADWPGPR